MMAKRDTGKFRHPYMAVACPACGAKVGGWCRRPSGHAGPMVAFHAARRKAFEEAEARIIRPGHPRWREFYDRLVGPEGCDFRADEQGGWSWRCNGGRDQSYSRAILQAMREVNVEGTLAYFADQGGHCDCEVVFNVAPDEEE